MVALPRPLAQPALTSPCNFTQRYELIADPDSLGARGLGTTDSLETALAARNALRAEGYTVRIRDLRAKGWVRP